ncbi:MAG: UBP-type zinc finger domain-containing protein [Chloroflexi bacterium]|nr:UBP-type zinc finger domain-containing protein [Chloroflexota bacterium]
MAVEGARTAVDCPHLGSIVPVGAGGTVCPSCVATGSTWVNLRQCLTCGEVACCDSSPNTHATSHHETTEHPIIRSITPGQDWMWCYVCQKTMRSIAGEMVEVDAFFELGLRFMGQHLAGGGSIDVAPDLLTAEGFPLGTWAASYRERGRRGELRDDVREALGALPGWSW